MYNIGLYLNDLSIHDASRDLVVVGNQKSAELKLALDQVNILRNQLFSPVLCTVFLMCSSTPIVLLFFAVVYSFVQFSR